MFLKSINYWSFPGGLEGKLDVSEFLQKAKRYGFPAVELCIFEHGAIDLNTDRATCEAILNEALSLGITISSMASGLYWNRSLGDDSRESRDQAADDLRKMIRIAGWFRAKTLLTIPGSVDVFFSPDRPASRYDEVMERAAEGIRPLLPLADECGVRLGIENVWNKFLLSPVEMARFIDDFRSEFVGAYVDVGNILAYGYPEHWLSILGKRVVGIHFKDYKTAVGNASGFVDLLEGDVDWPAVMQAIRKIGYEGPLVAEMIPGYKHHPEVRIANTSNAMDAILA